MQDIEMQTAASNVIATCRASAEALAREGLLDGPAEGAALRMALEVSLRIVSAAAARYGAAPDADRAIEAAGDALDRAIEAMARVDGLPNDVCLHRPYVEQSRCGGCGEWLP